MKELIFSYNWNNKLNNKYFTSIRMSELYMPGQEYKIVIKEKGFVLKTLGVAKIMMIKELYLHQINEFIAGLDTGYGVDECKKIIMRMYPDTDWKQKQIKLILFKYVG